MVFGVIYNQFKNVFDRIFGKMPRRVVKFLKNKGDLVITSMVIKRDPIMTAIDRVLNILSLGKWDEAKRDANYDKLFHLRLVITLSDGRSYTIEKNQTINVGGSVSKDTKDTESLIVPLSQRITVNELVERTIQKVGEDRFLDYDAFSTNCQRFVLDLLESNGLSDDAIKKFVYQDVEELLEKIPSYVDKISHIATDTAGYADRFRQALGFKRGGKVLHPQVKVKRPLKSYRRVFGKLR